MSVRLTHRDFFGDVERLLMHGKQSTRKSRADADRLRALSYAQIAKVLGNPKRKKTYLGKVRAQAVRRAEFQALPSLILMAGASRTISVTQARKAARAIAKISNR